MSTSTRQRAGGYAPERLPRPGRQRRRVGVALLALLASLALIVGIPALLVTYVGNPLPSTLPDRSWLTADVSATVVIRVLAVLIWVVWAYFVVAFVAEWRALRSGRVPAKVLFGGSLQEVARRLVAAILLLSGGASIAAGLSVMPPPAPVVAVQSIDHLGSVASVGDAAPAGPLISPDQAVAVAHERATAETKHYEVRPPNGRHHDTLWDIADRTLGDPLRYKEIYALNKDRVQPDGRRLVDADLIQPGWQLALPGDAKGPGVVSSPLSRTPAHTPGSGTSTKDSASTVNGGATADRATADGVTTARVTTASFESAAPSDASNGRGESTASLTSRSRTSADTQSRLGDLVFGGGLVLAGLATAVARRRGPFGDPDSDSLALAVAAAADRADLIDRGLRVLAADRADQGEPLPDLLSATVGEDALALHLTQAASVPPHEPWHAVDEGRTWTLERAALGQRTAQVAAPYPTLTTVVSADDHDVLVDIEAAPGLVSLGGEDPVAARDLAMAMAADLATHAWADSVELLMVGFGDELPDVRPRSVRTYATLHEALDSLPGAATEAGALRADLGLDGVLSGRVRTPRQHAPASTVIFLSGPPVGQDAERLARLCSGGRTAVSAVSVGDAPAARWRFALAADGTVDLGVLGVRGPAARLTSGARSRLEQLLAVAESERVMGERILAEARPEDLAGAARMTVPTGRVDQAPPADGVSEPLAVAPVVVRLLGPVVVEAPGPLDEARRAELTEVVVMALLAPDGLHDAVLRSALWPRGVEDDVADARLAQAQDWLGPDASGRSRLAYGKDGRWRLSDEVASDYAALIEAAAASGPGELDALLAALGLVRGEAFQTSDPYGWLAFVREARHCRLLATSAARRAAELAVGAGRTDDALAALTAGLTLVPTAEVLWRERLRLAARIDPAAVTAEVTQMYSVLAEHGVRPEPETDALARQLVPGPEGGAAVGS